MPVHGQIPVAFSLHRFVQATSPSAAPVSATTAEAAPAGAGAWRAPRCGPGSNWTETLCYRNPLVGIFFLYSFQGTLFFLLPRADTRSLCENRTLKLQSSYNEAKLLETSVLHPLLPQGHFLAAARR